MCNCVNAFIKKIKDIYPAEYVLPTNSGSGALISALYTCDLSSDDEVIIPVNSCAAIINALICVNVKPIFCDIDDKMQICFEDIKRVLSKFTKVIIVVHRFGSTCDLYKLRKLLNELQYRGVIIEDGAQAFGLKDTALLKPMGVSDLYITSFGYGKIIDADGGGLLLTNNKDIYLKAHRFSNLGADKIPFFLGYGQNFHLSKYLIQHILSEIEVLPENIEQRIRKAKYIYDGLKRFGFTNVQNSSKCVFQRLILKIPSKYHLSDIIYATSKNGVIVRKAYPYLLIDYDYIIKLFPCQNTNKYPNAIFQKENLISLYVDLRYNESDVARLVDIFNKI